MGENKEEKKGIDTHRLFVSFLITVVLGFCFAAWMGEKLSQSRQRDEARAASQPSIIHTYEIMEQVSDGVKANLIAMCNAESAKQARLRVDMRCAVGPYGWIFFRFTTMPEHLSKAAAMAMWQDFNWDSKKVDLYRMAGARRLYFKHHDGEFEIMIP